MVVDRIECFKRIVGGSMGFKGSPMESLFLEFFFFPPGIL